MNFVIIFLIVISVLIFIGVTISGCANVAYKKILKEHLNNASSVGLSGGMIAKESLSKAGVNVDVIKVEGKDIAAYDCKNKVVALSEEFYTNSSIIAEAIALHECGHAIQDSENDVKMKRFKKYSNASLVLIPFFWISFVVATILTFVLEPENLFIAFIVFGLSALFLILELSIKFTTMSMERNASKKGLAFLKEYGLTHEEEKLVKSVYKTALTTYFAPIFNPVVYIFKGITWLIYNTIGRLFR